MALHSRHTSRGLQGRRDKQKSGNSQGTNASLRSGIEAGFPEIPSDVTSHAVSEGTAKTPSVHPLLLYCAPGEGGGGEASLRMFTDERYSRGETWTSEEHVWTPAPDARDPFLIGGLALGRHEGSQAAAAATGRD